MNLKKLSATTEDATELSTIAKRAYCDHYLHLWHDNGAWYLDKCFSPEILLKELGDENALFYLLTDDKEPIGFIKLNRDAAIENYSKTQAIELERIYLIKAASNRGFGRLTMKFIINLAAYFNKETIWLKAMDTSFGAIGFYEKTGFDICGKTRLEFEVMHEELRGMVVMKRML